MESLRTLSPRRLQRLLENCHNVKVKRLFLWFAKRHGFQWLPQLSKSVSTSARERGCWCAVEHWIQHT